jgi:hypothetical protein
MMLLLPWIAYIEADTAADAAAVTLFATFADADIATSERQYADVPAMKRRQRYATPARYAADIAR